MAMVVALGLELMECMDTWSGMVRMLWLKFLAPTYVFGSSYVICPFSANVNVKIENENKFMFGNSLGRDNDLSHSLVFLYCPLS